jgi:uncharacterized membrane protein YagU involved in acid resistance
MNAKRATAAGVIGTAVITALWQVEPAIGLPRIAVGHILSTFMAVSVAHLNVGIAGGWVVHFIVGILLALLYAGVFAERLPGSPIWRGATYGVLVFILAQALFMPLVGGGFFSRGDVELLLGSLLGHIAYGIVVGWIYDLPSATVRATTAPRMA